MNYTMTINCKLEIKREMLLDHQLKIADYYISNGNVKKLVSNFFDKKRMCFITKTCNFILRIGLNKKRTLCIGT